MKKRNISIAAFSLVEVTLALGVVVFCLVTILGLLAVGINSTHVSTVQTSATNILTAVASDLESTPNITSVYPLAQAKGTVAEKSPLYGISLPKGGAGATANQTIYIGENGQTNASPAAALYQLNVWITASNTTTAPIHQETFIRLLISWPATVGYANAQGYVENILAINRT
jgi:hypothetical protein